MSTFNREEYQRGYRDGHYQATDNFHSLVIGVYIIGIVGFSFAYVIWRVIYP
jgi:hypothetical protein